MRAASSKFGLAGALRNVRLLKDGRDTGQDSVGVARIRKLEGPPQIDAIQMGWADLAQVFGAHPFAPDGLNGVTALVSKVRAAETASSDASCRASTTGILP
jgi:hypothetical protein